jgi:ketosteroid isomerase-like protein
MGEHENIALVKRGFEAFNTGDVATLSEMFVDDAHQHIPGKSQFAGDYQGRDDILGMYGRLADATNGTFRAELEGVEADGPDRVVATYLGRGEREGKSLGTKNRLTFTIRDGKFADLVDGPDDLVAWDDFWGS